MFVRFIHRPNTLVFTPYPYAQYAMTHWHGVISFRTSNQLHIKFQLCHLQFTQLTTQRNNNNNFLPFQTTRTNNTVSNRTAPNDVSTPKLHQSIRLAADRTHAHSSIGRANRLRHGGRAEHHVNDWCYAGGGVLRSGARVGSEICPDRVLL